MPTENIQVDGQSVSTLKELLRPGLKAIFVGLNPAPVSVEAGHYYQGRLGQRFWSLLRQFEIANPLRPNQEDDDAFQQAFGFADLVRRPTPNANDLTTRELRTSAKDLLRRLDALGDKPLIVFVFKKAADHAGLVLEGAGYEITRMPGPYAPMDEVRRVMTNVRGLIARRAASI